MTKINNNQVDLGFTEECEAWLLTSKYFPSKVGGKPAWLELENLPSQNELKCKICDEPCIFLCQIYSPKEEIENCFHRTIFVFICKNEKCCQPNSAQNLLVFRSQLSRTNKYFPYNPPDEHKRTDEIKSPVMLCDVCGCRGPLSCSKCKAMNYCGRVHQLIDWKAGHKVECGKTSETKTKNFLFEQFEIVMETEEKRTKELEEENGDEAEKRRLQEYENMVKAGKTGELKDVSEAEFSQFSIAEDSVFEKFKKRISSNPEQVIRYEWDSVPLWITSENILDKAMVPNCDECGSKRIFEFQIMPQLLNSLNEDSLDWGIITIFSCKSSCDTKSKYLKEFVYKQDIVKVPDV